jgi:EAL domain-containing protein (putative c-di-GMP-specific phosphodiesterase class I)/CheY-like chemotaxis protein
VRWQHPIRGLVPPGVFIPIAEENGLILPLGEWVMATACRQLRQWLDQGMKDLRMSVNLSARQFRQETLATTVSKLLDQYGLEPASLELEITESLAMDNPGENAKTLSILRGIGVELAIDDFGTGHSSLGYLKDFPITRLKLDRSFIMHIESEPNDAIIVAASINLAHDLGLQVIAEGVEDDMQVDYLTRLNCDAIQGYFFSKPLPAEEVESYIRRKNALPNMLYQSADMPSINVLVIDDDAFICEYLVTLFSGLGHKPDYATDPVQGLEKLRQEPGKYGLILADMLMPNMSGIDLVKEVRRCCRGTTIIAISAMKSDHVKRALKPLEKDYDLIPGVNYFVLEKPLSADALVRITDKVFMHPARLLLNV